MYQSTPGMLIQNKYHVGINRKGAEVVGNMHACIRTYVRTYTYIRGIKIFRRISLITPVPFDIERTNSA